MFVEFIIMIMSCECFGYCSEGVFVQIDEVFLCMFIFLCEVECWRTFFAYVVILPVCTFFFVFFLYVLGNF